MQLVSGRKTCPVPCEVTSVSGRGQPASSLPPSQCAGRWSHLLQERGYGDFDPSSANWEAHMSFLCAVWRTNALSCSTHHASWRAPQVSAQTWRVGVWRGGHERWANGSQMGAMCCLASCLVGTAFTTLLSGLPSLWDSHTLVSLSSFWNTFC